MCCFAVNSKKSQTVAEIGAYDALNRWLKHWEGCPHGSTKIIVEDGKVSRVKSNQGGFKE
jgi:hypothetical protein